MLFALLLSREVISFSQIIRCIRRGGAYRNNNNQSISNICNKMMHEMQCSMVWGDQQNLSVILIWNHNSNIIWIIIYHILLIDLTCFITLFFMHTNSTIRFLEFFWSFYIYYLSNLELYSIFYEFPKFWTYSGFIFKQKSLYCISMTSAGRTGRWKSNLTSGTHRSVSLVNFRLGLILFS